MYERGLYIFMTRLINANQPSLGHVTRLGDAIVKLMQTFIYIYIYIYNTLIIYYCCVQVNGNNSLIYFAQSTSRPPFVWLATSPSHSGYDDRVREIRQCLWFILKCSAATSSRQSLAVSTGWPHSCIIFLKWTRLTHASIILFSDHYYC